MPGQEAYAAKEIRVEQHVVCPAHRVVVGEERNRLSCGVDCTSASGQCYLGVPIRGHKVAFE